MRYFKNPYFNEILGQAVSFDRSFWSKFLIAKVEEILRNVPCNPDTAFGGLYTGSPGIAYALWYIARIRSDDVITSEQRQSFRLQGLSYCDSYFKMKRSDDPETSFLCGAAGVHVTTALLANDLGRQDICQHHVDTFRAIGNRLKPLAFHRHGSDEMLVGRAGYLAGALQLNRFVQNSLDHTLAKELYEAMISSGKKYSAQRHSPSPLMYSYYDAEYLGAAHGLSGILQELLSANGVVTGVNEPSVVRESVDFLLSTKQSDGNYAPDLSEVQRPRHESQALLHWCHGAPGVVYCLALAYRRYGDVKYLKPIFEASDLVWERGLLKKGPSICHGVAGNGYVHLLSYRLATSSEDKQKYLNRAIRFCEFLVNDEFQKHARVPDNPWSLYEGWAGALCYIADLLSNPDNAEFPFSDVFSF